MPRIVRYGGFNYVDEVVKIQDAALVVHARPAETPPEVDDAGGQTDSGFEQETFDGVSAPEGESEASHQADALPGEGEVHAAAPEPAVKSEIIQEAMAEASRIMQQALEQAQQARSEALASIPAEVEEIKRRAAEDGRREGFASMVQKLEQTAADVEKTIAHFEGQRAGFEVEYEEQLKWLATEIASKVLAKKVSEDDAVLADMVQKAVAGVKNEPWIRVEVAQEMARLIDALSEAYDGVANVQVSPVPQQAGTVHVETPAGIIDVSLRTQLANLKGYFVTGTS